MTTKSNVTPHANIFEKVMTENGVKIVYAQRFYTIVETTPSMYRLSKTEYMLHVLRELQEAQSEVMKLIEKDYEAQTK